MRRDPESGLIRRDSASGLIRRDSESGLIRRDLIRQDQGLACPRPDQGWVACSGRVPVPEGPGPGRVECPSQASESPDQASERPSEQSQSLRYVQGGPGLRQQSGPVRSSGTSSHNFHPPLDRLWKALCPPLWSRELAQFECPLP